ncbi:MAG: antibiotic biosynthesis monooxygenase [Candidatus Omnitrophica bacterium]|nr:antibiotic biosynthesis monooxygenase [Candidatus Omnitrophota bacterium]
MKKIVIARLYIKDGSVADFKKQAALIIEKTRQEKGCLFYSLFEDVSCAGEFLFYEEYTDQQALDIHTHSEYLKKFRAAVNDMKAKDSMVEVL